MSSQGFSGSVTHAWSGFTMSGVRSPTMSAIVGVHPATAESTFGVLTYPPLVRTPTTRPFSTSMPMTSVPWWISTPRRRRRPRSPTPPRRAGRPHRAGGKGRRRSGVPAAGQVDRGTRGLHVLGLDVLVYPQVLVHLGPPAHGAQRAVGVRQREVAALGVEEVVVEVAREVGEQPDALVVELHPLERQVVRADDRRVPTVPAAPMYPFSSTATSVIPKSRAR